MRKPENQPQGKEKEARVQPEFRGMSASEKLAFLTGNVMPFRALDDEPAVFLNDLEQEERPVITFDNHLLEGKNIPLVHTVRQYLWMTDYEQELEKARIRSFMRPGDMMSVHLNDLEETDIHNRRPRYEAKWKEFLATEAGQRFQADWKRKHGKV